MLRSCLFVCLIAMLPALHQCCIYNYGSRAELAEKVGHYSYQDQGYDWAMERANGTLLWPTCSGEMQSPIILPSKPEASVEEGAQTRISYGTLAAGATVLNNGHTIQVVLPDTFTSNVTVAVADTAGVASSALSATAANAKRVTAKPAQFHFHAHSEHAMAGAYYPLELHIVHFISSSELTGCGAGCPTVVGIMFELTENAAEASTLLDEIVEVAPSMEGTNRTTTKALDIDSLLPADRSYITYSGSLTTPPCTEGVLWHVLTTPLKMTNDQFIKYQQKMGDNYCEDAPSRRLQSLQSAFQRKPLEWMEAPVAEDGCRKLTQAHNFRAITPQGDGRVIKAYYEAGNPVHLNANGSTSGAWALSSWRQLPALVMSAVMAMALFL